MTDPTSHELERILNAYADARLSPDPRATAATRARVLREAEFSFAAARDAAAERAARASERRANWSRFGGRYGLIAAAVTLSVAFAGVALASNAGDPLYGVRVWFESATLPGAGDARASAELERLDARVMELAAAVDDGNGPGAAAAAAAYRAIVNEALVGAAGDDGRELQLEVALSRHVGVLTALLDKVPVSARQAIEHAIGASGTAIEEIGSPQQRPNESEGTGNPGRTPKPEKTPKPGTTQDGPGG